MTVSELIAMISSAHPEAVVKFSNVYDEVGPHKVTGMEFDLNEVILTDEEPS